MTTSHLSLSSVCARNCSNPPLPRVSYQTYSSLSCNASATIFAAAFSKPCPAWFEYGRYAGSEHTRKLPSARAPAVPVRRPVAAIETTSHRCFIACLPLPWTRPSMRLGDGGRRLPGAGLRHGLLRGHVGVGDLVVAQREHQQRATEV